MPRPLRMPSLAELRKGSRREFVEELFMYFRAARRPALREISDRIAGNDGLAGTASRETIRRMLNGTGIPTHWETVNAVFLALCELAEIDPTEQRGEDSYGDPSPSRVEQMATLWNGALDDEPPVHLSDDDIPFDQAA